MDSIITSINTNTDDLIAGTATRAVLVELSISTYSGRRKDRATEREVTQSKEAKSDRAASVYKSLFAECTELESISRFQAKARALHYRWTMPWSDNGSRILPLAALADYEQCMSECDTQFHSLVNAFLDRYDLLVSAAAFKLGQLFNRSEYPTRESVARKFSFRYATTPLPTGGDFRLDAEREVQLDLTRKYERVLQERLQQASLDLWHQLHDVLDRMSDRLASDEEGKRKKIYDSVIDGSLELCERLTKLNVTKDPHLEEARKRLEKALCGVSPEDIRKSDGLRLEVKRTVDAMLSDYDWGSIDD